MSEAMTIPPLGEAPAKRTPTVYFIDDSATMREVIKIAFRRENINVITCADAASALAQFEQNRPDVVITDVIMPDQDGYSVCSQIKQHPDFSETPVVLMSGVVNKSVADKAVSVKADELIRKPFQPQELIGRVKSLLEPKCATPAPVAERSASSSALSNLFSPPPVPVAPRHSGSATPYCASTASPCYARICLATRTCRGVHSAATFAGPPRSPAIDGLPGSARSDGGRRPETPRRDCPFGPAREEATNGTSDRAAIQSSSGNADSHAHGSELAVRTPACYFF